MRPEDPPSPKFPGGCPELEQLFSEVEAGTGDALGHARGCAGCSALIEEHRQLEKDLFRLADPLPPPDFVHRVMARVAAEPLPARRELWTGLGILAASLLAAMGVLLSSDAALSGAGTGLARSFMEGQAEGQALLEALRSGSRALWLTAAVPTAALFTLFLFPTLFGIKRLASPSSPPSEAGVSP